MDTLKDLAAFASLIAFITAMCLWATGLTHHVI